ncbi:hypothetical protein Lal_00040299 [Lupinus albus]|uniref:RING-type E3 ubiquitin transferase n=1 Tax=Lupinus albus TaxID=3870 RepID=A0A6A5N1B5_LUPAL|nr:putative aminoacyltransferase, E1 ubiquitin-activating enzyme [Lupinus albus]KAF1877583.1 hypothetical protein Lal_00040299 [Lupinus albus]
MDPILNISLFQEEEEEEEEEDHHSYYHSDSDSVSCFVTDLFESRSSHHDFNINPFSGVLCDLHHEPQLGLGFQFETHNNNNSQPSGLRVVDFGSDSDSDSSSEDEHDIDRVMMNNDDDDDDRVGGFDDFDVQLCWDSLCLEDQRTLNEGFEWEEVEERVNEIENEREDLSLMIDEVDINDDDDDVDDQSVASGFSNVDEPSEEALRYLEWEILLAVNNLERNPILEHDANVDSYLAVQDGYIYTAEYDVLFGQFMDNETALKGSPPAAKSVMENLPVVELSKEELQMKNVACAVCKDEILLEEKVRRLPCFHCYHGDCIMPWLSIRNTCPVCRFELPTDDPDYEQRKSRQAANDALDFSTQMQF